MAMTTKSYVELRRIDGYIDRFRYASLRGDVGRSTFGFDRWVNQGFYTSREWRTARHGIIVRDNGCDLGVDGYEIHSNLHIHHLNPITMQQIEDGDDCLLDPDNLITVSQRTHNAIHYGDEKLLPQPLVKRKPGDTNLW